MVTTSQLHIVRSPITSLISSISTSVILKPNDSNYLPWHFQMQLLLEGQGIVNFVDGFIEREVLCVMKNDSHSLNNYNSTREYI